MCIRDRVSFSFEWTETWANAPWLNAPERAVASDEDAAILDELRLDGHAYARVRRAALLEMLATEEGARLGIAPDRHDLALTAMRFRSPRGLTRQSDVEQWAAKNGMEASRLQRMKVLEI